MKVMVVGSGAREHALAWKLKRSPKVSRVFVAPGNAGTEAFAANLPIAPEDTETLALAATRYGLDLTVVGPEVPLAQGIVDQFERSGLTIFGPNRDAARIESSKAFARNLMEKHSIPAPEFKIFNSYTEGYYFLAKHEGQVVVKADGLAAGKGAFVCRDREAAINALYDCMEDRIFGPAGTTVVVEECLEGSEISVFAFCDGEHISAISAACDYKRLLDGDRGPNTGGMGSHAPSHLWTKNLQEQVRKEIMEPTVKAMAQEGTPYKGVLYAGIMITDSGPKVLEFNCRLGDPEAQTLIPAINTDLVDVIMASIEGNLNGSSINWGDQACVGVVMAARGYPGEYRRGLEVQGLNDLDDDALVFHAGTRRPRESAAKVLTTGGRVLTVVGSGPTIAEARDRVYENVDRISFQGCYYRKDIALTASLAIKEGKET
jgi:phosphoribosylamine--glycine ligase